ncbi:MAG: aldehyde dehydrogenase (NADP(+)) [Planctomycetota bacterium]|nr:aldehyde dehydrogenase (NADP(+)) [Planctomycetota bacterium]
MTIQGVHLIAGEDVPGEGSLQAANPSTGDRLEPVFPEATSENIDAAVRSALQVHVDRAAADPAKRAQLLEAAADRIEAMGSEITERGMQETGLPEARFEGERGRTCQQLRMFASVAREGLFQNPFIETALPEREPVPRPDLRTRMHALGPVAVFGASNFPLAFGVAGGDTASAWAAGCPVIAKSHPAHPGVCELVGRALQDAIRDVELPAGMFSLLQGESHDVGIGLVQHPEIRAVAFTGSRAGGISLWRLAAEREVPVPVFAEMGSTNPVFISPAAMEQRHQQIAEGLAGSVRLGVGQFCTSPGVVVFLADDHAATFKEELSRSLCGDPVGTMLHQGISSGYLDAVEQLATRSGVQVIARGPSTESVCGVGSSLFHVDFDGFIADPAMQEEVFGPATLLVECSSFDQIKQVASALEGQLTATIHATEQEIELLVPLIQLLEDRVGRLVFNGFPTGVEVGESMQHGGPWPATTDSRWTSVGCAAIERFLRPVCWQGFPEAALPVELRSDASGMRRVDGVWHQLGNS